MGREGAHENVTLLESIHLLGGFWVCYQELMWNVFFGGGGWQRRI